MMQISEFKLMPYRYLPMLVDKLEVICEEAGVRGDSIVMRMTGCPNGCARPWGAEIAFVGKAPGSYMVSHHAQHAPFNHWKLIRCFGCR